jgi:hypothetical protein
MQDTGERREITRFVNAKEAETIQHSNRIVSKTKQQSVRAVQEAQSRKGRKAPPPSAAARSGKAEEARQDREASDRMADEGDPNPKP